MSKPGDADQGITMFLLLGLLALVAYGIWYFFHREIIEAIRYVRVAELYVVGMFADQVIMPDGNKITPQELYRWLSSNSADNLNWQQMATVSTTIVPQFLRWPVVIILLILAGIGYKFSPRRKLRHVLTLEDLIMVQSKAWPIIGPITKVNPATGPQRSPGDTLTARLPIFAEALSPEEFVAFHHIAVKDRIIDRESAERVFVRQLGVRWQGFDKLPMHYQALAAVFAIKGARQRDRADKLLQALADCWSPKTGLIIPGKLQAEIRKVLRDPKIGGEAAKIMSCHAFVIPGMFRLLLWARERGGVLAAAAFLWLRAVDRTLWYPLNNAGRRTFHAEAAGMASHYFAEKFLRRPLIIPKLQAAVDALADHMRETEVPVPAAAPRPPKNNVKYSAPRRSVTGSLVAAGGNA
jgi:intracellular multiplication protein IcmP